MMGDEAVEALAVHCFLGGVNPALRRTMQQQPWTTLREAMAGAEKLERQLAHQSGPASSATRPARGAAAGNGSVGPTAFSKRIGDLICYRCGKKGHKADRCRATLVASEGAPTQGVAGGPSARGAPGRR